MNEKLTVDDIDSWYEWDAHEVYHLERTVRRINNSEWYKLLKEEIKCGNSKIAKNTWIFSVSPATDCPHLNGEQCQVPKDSCYAYKAEIQYSHSEKSPGGPLHRKRRLSVIWDCMDAQTFANTLIDIYHGKSSKSRTIEYLRLNEAGDIRSYHDLHKVNEIAKILKDQIDVQTYLYSATYLNPQTAAPFNWPDKEDRNFTLMGSNDQVGTHADTRFTAKLPENVAEDDIVCPAEKHGRDTVKCGDCRLCPEGLVDEVVVPLH